MKEEQSLALYCFLVLLYSSTAEASQEQPPSPLVVGVVCLPRTVFYWVEPYIIGSKDLSLQDKHKNTKLVTRE